MNYQTQFKAYTNLLLELADMQEKVVIKEQQVKAKAELTRQAIRHEIVELLEGLTHAISLDDLDVDQFTIEAITPKSLLVIAKINAGGASYPANKHISKFTFQQQIAILEKLKEILA